MTLPSQEYFDMKFDAVHTRITESDKAHALNIAELSKELAAHKAAPCPEALPLMEKHMEKCHDVAKFWGTIAAIAGAASVVTAGAIWLIQVVTHKL